jgi:hypothetical protein
MPMEQQNKPVFGTSDFAVSAMESSEYIDVTAEESCPAESAPTAEARAAAETPSAATLEVMDQLKALAQNVTQGSRTSFNESNVQPAQSSKSEDAGTSDPGGSPAPEPSISVFPRPSGFESSQIISGRSKSGKVLAVAGFVMAAVIGAAATFAWQAQNKPAEVAKAAAPAPVAAAPVIAPYLGRQLEDLAQDISSVRARMEELAAKQEQLAAAQQQLDQLAAKQQQLTAKQEQAGQSIAKLQALEQTRQRAHAPIQTRAAPVASRPYVPPPPPVEATVPPPPPPQTASHPIPPAPVPMTR